MNSRRQFFGKLAVGSAAVLAGCDVASPMPTTDAGTGCPDLVPPATPPALAYPPPSYFAQLREQLNAAGIGVPALLIDFDRLDANVDAIVDGIAPLDFRIVEKSLASLDLLDYVAERSGSSRFLVLHLPLLTPLLERFGAEADVVIGKTHTVDAVASFFDRLPASLVPAEVAAQVVFLVDGPERLAGLRALALLMGLTLRVAVELDVGLARSGIEDPSELRPLLDLMLNALGDGSVRFAGFLGYDGHIAHTPAHNVPAVELAWSEATARYQSFVDVLSEPAYAALASLPGLIFQSGGTSSYPMYAGRETPVNDVATGGGVVRPGGYPDLMIPDLMPAIWVAMPVLRRYEAPRVPFFSAEDSARLVGDRIGVTLHGGGVPAYFTDPPDVRALPLVSDPTDVSWVPNQGLVTLPRDTVIEAGDWVFFHPRSSEVIFQFERIHQVRGGALLPDTMGGYPVRY